MSTKMPFQYLHMVNFLLFIFVFSAPFIHHGLKWPPPILVHRGHLATASPRCAIH